MQHFALTLLFVEGSFEHGKQEGAIGLFASQFGDDVAQCELGNGFCGDMARKIVPDGGVVFEDDNHTLANMVELFFFAESRDGLLCRGQCLGVFKPVLPEMMDCFFHAVEHALAEIQITFTFRGVAEIGVERALEIERCGSCGELALRSKMIVDGSNAHVAV